MRIVIIGDGKVGHILAQQLIRRTTRSPSSTAEKVLQRSMEISTPW